MKLKPFLFTALAAATGVGIAGFVMNKAKDIDFVNQMRKGFDV